MSIILFCWLWVSTINVFQRSSYESSSVEPRSNGLFVSFTVTYKPLKLKKNTVHTDQLLTLGWAVPHDI